MTNKVIESGYKTLFKQTTPPLGWTKDTSINNYTLRVTSGAGGGLGGVVDFSTALSDNKTCTVVLDKSNPPLVSVSAHALTVAQLPSHNHDMRRANLVPRSGGSSSGQAGPLFSSFTGLTGGSGSHAHDAGTIFNQLSFNNSTPISFDVRYVDVIVATRD